MDEKSYADLVALCQLLPGPASSQVGIGIGVLRGGFIGGIISFLGFTLPSVFALIVFASFLDTFGIENAGWINGLKIVAVVVVAHAIIGMAKNFTPNIQTKLIALFALILTLLFHSAYTQIAAIIIAGFIGFIIFRKEDINKKETTTNFPISKEWALYV